MNNLEAINLVEDYDIDITYRGIEVDPTPCDGNMIALVNLSEPNDKHLSDVLIAKVSVENFLNVTLNKKGKF